MENTGVDTGAKVETGEMFKVRLSGLVAKFVEGDQTVGIDVNFGEYLSTKGREQFEISLRRFQAVGLRIRRLIAREDYDSVPPLRSRLEHTEMNLLIGDKKIATRDITVSYLSSEDPENMPSSDLFERCIDANLGEHRREKDSPKAESLAGNYMRVTFSAVEVSIRRAETPEQLGSEVKSKIHSLLVSNIEAVEFSMRGVYWRIEGVLPGKSLKVLDMNAPEERGFIVSNDYYPKILDYMERFLTPE